MTKLTKGSEEARAHMAKLRAMRKKKGPAPTPASAAAPAEPAMLPKKPRQRRTKKAALLQQIKDGMDVGAKKCPMCGK